MGEVGTSDPDKTELAASRVLKSDMQGDPTDAFKSALYCGGKWVSGSQDDVAKPQNVSTKDNDEAKSL